jgi:HEAT repeat protein
MRTLALLLGTLLTLNGLGLYALSRKDRAPERFHPLQLLESPRTRVPSRIETVVRPDLEAWELEVSPAAGGAEAVASEGSPTDRLLAQAEALEALASDDPRAALEQLPTLLGQPSTPPILRIKAARLLGETGSPRATAVLLSSLSDPDPLIRLAVIGGLGLLRDVDAVPALAARLDSDLPRLQAAAAWALGEIGDTSALASLVQFLASGRDVPAAVRALGRLGDPRAAAVLFPLLQPPERGVAEYVLEALARLKAPGTLEALVRVLEGADEALAAEAARALSILGDPRAIPSLEARLPGAKPLLEADLRASIAALNRKAAR